MLGILAFLAACLYVFYMILLDNIWIDFIKYERIWLYKLDLRRQREFTAAQVVAVSPPDQ